jgi:hypothetical protein
VDDLAGVSLTPEFPFVLAVLINSSDWATSSMTGERHWTLSLFHSQKDQGWRKPSKFLSHTAGHRL